MNVNKEDYLYSNGEWKDMTAYMEALEHQTKELMEKNTGMALVVVERQKEIKELKANLTNRHQEIEELKIEIKQLV